jgi:Ni/Co efflux regulator RcnB
MRRFLLALILAAIAISPAAGRSTSSGRSIARSEPRSHRGEARSEARNSSTGHTSRGRAAGSHARSTSTRCATCERDANGRIKRDPGARRTFQRQHPCPGTGRTSGTCPGYVVDHVVPLKRGGADKPENMQWQTKEAAKAKDRIE